MNGLKFKIEEMFTLEAGSLAAVFNFSINNSFVVRGARILNGKRGLFISMPAETGKDGKYYDQFIFRNVRDYDDLSKKAVLFYKELTKKTEYA